MFERSYNELYKTNDQIKIDLIKDESKLLKEFEKRKVLNIIFDLKPSNPEDEEDFKIVDDLIKKSKAKKARIKIENTDGLDLSERQGLARQGVALTSAGYGEYNALVEEDGRYKTIRSKGDILREVFDVSSFSNDIIFDILKRFERYHKSDKGDKSAK